MLKKVVSGAQTGADRGALIAAMKCGLECGGWCPKGRRAEDGRIPDEFPLQESPSKDYPQRTEWNVRDSDGTVVFGKVLSRGCTLTITKASQHNKPILVLKRYEPEEEVVARIVQFIRHYKIVTLNVAGNRESKSPGLQSYVERIISAVIDIENTSTSESV